MAEVIITILTAVTAAGALVAAGAASWSAHVTKRAAQGQLFASLLRDYSSEDMLKALKRLGYLRDQKEQGTNLAKWLKSWEERRKSIEVGNAEIDDARRIDEARRRVCHYFLTALELYENKQCIDEDFLKVICRQYGFELLYEVVEDLEQAINPEYDRSQFDRLLNFYTGSQRKKRWLETARPRKKGR